MTFSIRLGKIKGKPPIKESELSFFRKTKHFQATLLIYPRHERFIRGKKKRKSNSALQN